MKRIIFGWLLWTLPFCGLWAQGPGEELTENDQIRSQRVAYITQRLSLTPAEAGHFWTVYSEYEEERRTIAARYRNENPRPLTADEADRIIQNRFQMEDELLQLKRRFYDNLREEISPRKLVLLPKAEREFKQDLLRQLRQRRRG